MGADDPAGDGQTEPRAGPTAGLVGPVEPVEDALLGAGRHTHAVVGHRELDDRATLGDRDPDVAAVGGELHRVVDEDPQQLGEQVLVAGDRPGRRTGKTDHPPRVQRGRLPAHRLGQGADVDRFPAQLDPAAVGPGQREQVLDEPAHPHRLAGDVAQRLVPVGRTGVGVLQQELGVVADRRQRGAQLVRGVRGEPLLGGQRAGDPAVGLLQPVHHRVEARREPADGVLGRGLCRREASAEVGRPAHLVGHGGHLTQRAQGPAGGHPHRDRRGHQGDQPGDGEQRDQPGPVLGDPAAGLGGHGVPGQRQVRTRPGPHLHPYRLAGGAVHDRHGGRGPAGALRGREHLGRARRRGRWPAARVPSSARSTTNASTLERGSTGASGVAGARSSPRRRGHLRDQGVDPLAQLVVAAGVEPERDEREQGAGQAADHERDDADADQGDAGPDRHHGARST